jgi:hypothetical protein
MRIVAHNCTGDEIHDIGMTEFFGEQTTLIQTIANGFCHTERTRPA